MVRKKPRTGFVRFTESAGNIASSLFGSDFARTFIATLLALAIAGYVAAKYIRANLPLGNLPTIPKIIPRPWKSEDAIGRIQFGNSGCTGTVIGPVHDDDTTIDILTAAHCVQVGAVGKMKLKDGRVFTVKCVSRAAGADVAWLRAERPEGSVPSLLLADVPPPPDSQVWHMGYGIHVPGNLEEGRVVGIAPNNLQVQYRLSVSPGDSGGGIIATKEGRVISPVCCTTRLSATGDVWGGTPAEARKIRPGRTAGDDGRPIAVHPLLDLDERHKTTGEPWIE